MPTRMTATRWFLLTLVVGLALGPLWAKGPARPEDLNGFRLAMGPVRMGGIQDNASGLVFQPDRKSLFVVVNKPAAIHEVTLQGKAVRKIVLDGFEDPEDITYLGHDWFAVVEERRGAVVFFPITAKTTVVDYETCEKLGIWSLIGLSVSDADDGLEGLCYDMTRKMLYAAREKKPMQVFGLPWPAPGSTRFVKTEAWKIDKDEYGINDLSGLALRPGAGTFLLLSDKSAAVLECAFKGPVLHSLSMAEGEAGLSERVPKAEGITLDDQGNLFICSEPNLLYKFVPNGK